MNRDTLRHEWTALRRGAGVSDLGHRSQVELQGRDRATVLHGLCTNDIKRLAAGSGCEAFLTNGQGKTIGHVYVFARNDSLVVDTVPGCGAELLAAIDRYVIREEVQLTDRSLERRELLLSGTAAAELLQRLAGTRPPADRLAVAATELAGCPVEVRRVDFVSADSFFLCVAAERAGDLLAELCRHGAAACGSEAVETARIEMGTPLYGQDITAENLPQEVGRDQLAISFTKGCYLGQETVARIDALGHVNRRLVGLRMPHEAVVEPGTELASDGKPVARVTSACWSPQLGGPLALAYVRRGSDSPGKRLQTQLGEVEVLTLPIVPPG